MNEPEDRAWEEAVRESYRRPPGGEAEARARLAARLAQEPPPRTGLLAWWLAAGALEMRPVVALLALGVVTLAGVWLGRVTAPVGRSAAHAPAASAMLRVPAAAGYGRVPTAFVLDAPEASTVALVGDFNGWDAAATPLRRDATGSRWATEIALEPGLHAYAFVIDDRSWSLDPAAPQSAETAYGRHHSVVLVAAGGVW